MELKASLSRIKIVDFEGVPSYTEDGLPASRRQSGASAVGDVTSAAAKAAPRCERFDVQRAHCTLREDEEALRSAIEGGCVAGVDTFNAWMHELLTTNTANTNGATAAASPAKQMTLP